MLEKLKIQIDGSWRDVLKAEFESDYFAEIQQFLLEEKRNGKIIFPPENEIYNAFNLCPLPKVKCVIIGQDPYHGPNQAHGLAFSVRKGIKPPPSLVNIYKELNISLSIEKPLHGELTEWAKQGVLLLNSVLTVEAHEPASHQKRGWENFTDAAIKTVSDQRENVVFMLWGKFAQGKKSLINASKHLILETTHPSPFSARKGYLGSGHFKKCNEYLAKNGLETIKWLND